VEDTTVRFDTAGSYVIALIVDDGSMADAELLTVTVTGGNPDANGNDVPDIWEATHEDPAQPGTVLLEDGNHYAIRDVYFWGVDSTSGGPLKAEGTAANGAGSFSFHFHGVNGVTYRVMRNGDLTNPAGWTELSGYESVSGAVEAVTVTDPSPLPNGVYRVEVVLP
jgi:hypothetical protein